MWDIDAIKTKDHLPNSKTAVIRIDKYGEVRKYGSIGQAATLNGTYPNKIIRYIASGKPLNGFTFDYQ